MLMESERLGEIEIDESSIIDLPNGLMGFDGRRRFVLIPADEIRHTAFVFQHSDFVQQKVDLPAVAEPAALLAGRRTQLLLRKQVLHGVTVAIARENCGS